jgi:Dehydrogenases with different specificities (related to short-chain alcohol dehydrogenases)
MEYLDNLFNVQDKVAVITGGSGILGGEIAKGLSRAGAIVIILGTNEERINKKLEYIGSSSNQIAGFVCDVLNEDLVIKVNKIIIEKFRKIDILINAAGGNLYTATLNTDQTFFDMDIEGFRKAVDLNLIGTVFPTQIFSASMAEQKHGSIINISSMASFKVISRVAGYSAAKAGIDNFTKWLAVEMAIKFGNGIRVNAIAPGFLLTDQNRHLLTNNDGSLTDRGNSIISMTPFKRFGFPDELIGTVIWLASDASRFVTGTTTSIDGGFSIFSGV